MRKEWIYLVLLTIALICPWPIIALTHQRERSPYIVAVPADSSRVDAPISPIFARSRYFFIVNLESSKFKILENRFRAEKHAVGLQIAHLLIDQNVGAVLVNGHIGPEPFNNLNARKVAIYNCAGSVGQVITVQEGVDLYKRQMLPRIMRPTVPTHYGL
jgi:predicted Fe-Mo cluster-binding NifX family protein